LDKLKQSIQEALTCVELSELKIMPVFSRDWNLAWEQK
jgi:hypothetical protein